jgi:hypothetical protein
MTLGNIRELGVRGWHRRLAELRRERLTPVIGASSLLGRNRRRERRAPVNLRSAPVLFLVVVTAAATFFAFTQWPSAYPGKVGSTSKYKIWLSTVLQKQC